MKYRMFTKPAKETPQVLYCNRDRNIVPGARYGPVIRNVYILECCTAGYGSVIINDKEFPVGPGDCYILLPGDTVVHTADKVHPREGVSCMANGLSLGRLFDRAGITSAQPFAPPELFPAILSLMEEMLSMKNENNLSAELHRTACLYHILGTLFKELHSADRDTVVQRAVGIMELRYSEPLSTQKLANYIGLERSYFSTFFKAQTGVPPHRYLTRLRIQKACELMDRGHIPISTVAESVGLDAQNFSRIFKREMGITPLQYKQRSGA